MYLNKQKLRELMRKKADDNYHEFARQLGADVSQVHRIINTNCQAGPKFLGRFKIYCDKMGIEFYDYIFLHDPLHADNEGNHTGTDG